jgi:hypothetical protein
MQHPQDCPDLSFNVAPPSDFNRTRLNQNLFFASSVLFCGQVSDEILISHKKAQEGTRRHRSRKNSKLESLTSLSNVGDRCQVQVANGVSNDGEIGDWPVGSGDRQLKLR